jgi:hypothetical protein
LLDLLKSSTDSTLQLRFLREIERLLDSPRKFCWSFCFFCSFV